MTTPTWTVGDTSPALTGTVAANLTGATLEAHVRWRDGTVLSRAATATDAANGAWEMAWQTGDLTVIGPAVVELEVTFSSGDVQTFGLSGIHVRDEIA